jgi:ribosome biogenesis GTPase
VDERRGEGLTRGRVVRVDRGGVEVSLGSRLLRVDDPAGELLVGDWVTVDGEGPRAALGEVLARSSVLSRASASRTSDEQPLAANVDVVVIVEPAWPGPSVGRIERLLVLAWSSGATPVVALTKTDQVDDTRDVLDEVRGAALGVEVLPVSAHRGDGLDALRERLGPGRTFVLVGPSGAGKSTLVNAFAGERVLATADVRSDGRGRHTTTHRQLVELPDGSALIDTPGLRSVGLVGDEAAVDDVFGDIADLARQCRFRDCAHDSEPGCAVQAALEEGRVTDRRLESWRRLAREAAFQARRGDARLEREERARVRARTKMWRSTPTRPSR